MHKDAFSREIEQRLDENRRLAESSKLPTLLKPLASYMGFHAFRGLVIVSLVVTLGLFAVYFEELLAVGRWVFWL